MQIERRSFVSRTLKSLLAMGAVLAIGLPACAQTAGKDYTVIEPAQPTDNPAKIEVTEFFSYGCPHCSDFNPLVSAWAAKLPADVTFKKVPVSFNSYFAMLAPMSYALESTGQLARLDGEVFKAIHERGIKLENEKTRAEWVASMGVDARKFDEAYKSFGVMSKVKRAEQMTQLYRVRGVPALAVDGKYLVTGKDFNDTLAIADKLIAKARAEKAKK
ncbi:MAG: oxidoreductase [Rhodocyclaceae bacterium]|nr:oxidoreductase [Rhodocyclaceae bacterium]